jgi:Pyridoxamine 5'-phosphate oxidase
MAKAKGLRKVVEPVASRPQFPKGYGIKKARAGLLRWAFVDERMSTARNYWIVTSRPDSRPHAVPVWGVWLERNLYFSTDRNSRKSRNLRQNPAIVVHLESGDDVVILEGAASLAENGQDLAAIDEAYLAKYGMRVVGFMPTSVIYAVTPSVAFAWREKDFDVSATRWRLA